MPQRRAASWGLNALIDYYFLNLLWPTAFFGQRSFVSLTIILKHLPDFIESTAAKRVSKVVVNCQVNFIEVFHWRRVNNSNKKLLMDNMCPLCASVCLPESFRKLLAIKRVFASASDYDY